MDRSTNKGTEQQLFCLSGGFQAQTLTLLGFSYFKYNSYSSTWFVSSLVTYYPEFQWLWSKTDIGPILAQKIQIRFYQNWSKIDNMSILLSVMLEFLQYKKTKQWKYVSSAACWFQICVGIGWYFRSESVVSGQPFPNSSVIHEPSSQSDGKLNKRVCCYLNRSTELDRWSDGKENRPLYRATISNHVPH